jgi:predicted permease
MDSSTIVILTAMLTVAFVVCLGAMARQLNWLSQEADRSLMNLTVKLLLPCLILDVIVGNPRLTQASNLVYPPVAGFALTAGSMIISLILARLFGKYFWVDTPVKQRTFAFTAGVVNYGFIPVPLTQVLFQDTPDIRDATMGVLLVHNAGVELAIWTVGIVILTGSVTGSWWKRVVNPVSMAIVAALLINYMGWHTLGPQPIRHGLGQAIHLLGAASIPLSLALVGASTIDHLATLNPRHSLRVIGFGALIRLGLLPCLFMLAAWLCPVSDELKRVLVIQGAMPSAMAPIFLARHYEGDPATALRVAMGTTLLALLTIPFWLHGGLKWIGLGL